MMIYFGIQKLLIMKTTTAKSDSVRHFNFPFLAIGLLLGFSILACSRSPWMKPDGHEVSPTEHVKCAQQVQQLSNGEALEQVVLTQRIEQCMLDHGYYRRPWWLLNDLRWDIKEPAY